MPGASAEQAQPEAPPNSESESVISYELRCSTATAAAQLPAAELISHGCPPQPFPSSLLLEVSAEAVVEGCRGIDGQCLPQLGLGLVRDLGGCLEARRVEVDVA